MIRGVNHAAIATDNLDRLVAFYVDQLGFEKVDQFGWPKGVAEADQLTGLKDSEAKCAVIRTGMAFLEIFEFTSPEGKAVAPDRPLNDRGISHISLDVTELDEEFKRLSDAGMTFISEPMWAGDGVRACYGRDPDGNVIELQEISNEAHPMHWSNQER